MFPISVKFLFLRYYYCLLRLSSYYVCEFLVAPSKSVLIQFICFILIRIGTLLDGKVLHSVFNAGYNNNLVTRPRQKSETINCLSLQQGPWV